jgi:ligand-binding sensor domain-containing protein
MKNIFRFLFVALCLFETTKSLQAQWIQTGGLSGAIVNGIAVHGTNLFAATSSGGIFLSTNNGTNWIAVNNGLSRTDVYSLAVSDTNLFAGTGGGGVFLSTDNGTSWAAVNNGLADVFSRDVRAIVASPNVAGRTNIFAGTIGGVFLSTNNGSSWTAVNNGIANNGMSYDITSLVFNGTNLFAGSNGGGIFLSTNNGTNWIAVNNGLTNTNVRSIAVSDANLYAGTDKGVFHSTNNGTSWAAMNNGFPSGCFGLALTIAGSNVFAGTNGGGVYHLTDNDTSWTAANIGMTYAYVLYMYTSGTNLFAGTTQGVFLSTNNGTSWSAINNGLMSSDVKALAVSGTNLFAGTYGGGVYLSTNNGTNWTAINNGMSNYVRTLAVAGTNVFAGTDGNGVFLSTNNGTSWTIASTGLTKPWVFAFATSGTNIFAGTNSGGIFLSTNIGTSWIPVNNGLTNYYVYSLAISGTNLFAGTFKGVFLSTNNGTNWTAVNSGLNISYYRVLAVSGTIIFAGTYGGVYLSTDNGGNWIAANAGLENTDVFSLAVSDTYLYAGTDKGVFRSTNNGTSWIAASTGLMNTPVQALAVSGTNLFAGTSGGVFRRSLLDWLTSLSPADGVVGVTLPVTFMWGANSQALTYTFQISTDANFSNLVINQNTADITLTVSNLQLSTSYYWRVRAESANWASEWGGGRFTTKLSSSPQLLNPAAGATAGSRTPTLSWNPLVSSATYSVQLSTDSTFRSLPYAKDTSGTSVIVPQLLGSTLYYWRVRAYVSSDTSIWSEARSFTTLPNAPPSPSLVYPVDAAVDIPTRVTLRWNKATDATSYAVQVSASPQFTSFVVNQSNIADTTFASTNPYSVSTQLFWKVSAQNAGGSSPFASPFRFTTTAVSEVDRNGVIPNEYSLAQNHPNPFNPSTMIRYELPKASRITLRVFSTLGEEVAVLVDEQEEAGVYQVRWNAHVPSGVYFYRLQAGQYTNTKKMLLLR